MREKLCFSSCDSTFLVFSLPPLLSLHVFVSKEGMYVVHVFGLL
jgi:hypothetical protein